jgi:hypothetical protein
MECRARSIQDGRGGQHRDNQETGIRPRTRFQAEAQQYGQQTERECSVTLAHR